MRVPRTALCLLVTSATLLAACPKRTAVPSSERRATGTVEVFTEAGPVHDVVAFQETLWVATGNGLVAWDLKRMTARTVTVDDGLPGNDARALARGPDKALWVATTAGIARYKAGSWTQYGDCPLGNSVTSLAVGDGAVYAGSETGLARLRGERWTVLIRGTPVSGLYWSAVHRALWVGTLTQGMLRCVGQKCQRYGQARLGGLQVQRIAGGAGGLLAILGPKRDRVSLWRGGRWYQYRPTPHTSVAWIHFAGKRLLLSAGRAAYALREREEPETPTGPIELAPQTRGAAEFISERIRKQLPRHVTAVRRALGWLWIGSRQLGVARFNGDALQYFRTNDLTRDARRLSLDCPPSGACLLCTGAHLFRRARQGWTPISYPPEAEASFQWIGRYHGAPVAVLRNGRGGLEVALRQGPHWRPLELTPALRSHRGRLSARFARIGPLGTLWIGLLLGQGEEAQGVGVAAVNLKTGAVVLHGRGADLPRTPGALGIPSDITGVAFAAGTTYLATLRGVVQIRPNGSVRTFDENAGIPSELIQDIDLAPNGHIWVATPQGLGEFDGATWRFGEDGPQASQVTAVRVAPDGTLWFTSNTGVHRLRGGKLRTWDDASGLLSRAARGLARDGRGRVWVLHEHGLSLVTP